MPDVPMEVLVDKHANLLLVGKGATNYSLKNVSYETDYDEVLEKYGESDLSRAFKIAQDMGAEYIFLMNLKNSYDYFDVKEVIRQEDFTYIVPVSIYMSDTFTDFSKDGAKISLVAYLLSLISEDNSESVIMATDKHASLYEDLDSFIDDMDAAERLFTASCGAGMNMENICFVANNLLKTDMANVLAAAALCVADVPEYPAFAFGKAIFDIDTFDTSGNWAYFRNHSDGSSSIENMVNFLERQPEKIISISRIVKMIKRELDFSEFCGKNYSEYQRMRFERKLDAYLAQLTGYVIYKYQILSVKAYKNIHHKGTVTMKAVFDVWPVNCLERCHVEKGVNI